MINVAKDTQEEGVIRAFEGILVQSQAPPRQPAPSQPPPAGNSALAPSRSAASPPAVSVATNAALTAVGSTGGGAIVPPQRTGTPGQVSGTPRKLGPAEANLLGLLMGGPPARSSSNTPPIPISTSPTVPSPGQVHRAPQVGATVSVGPLVTATVPASNASALTPVSSAIASSLAMAPKTTAYTAAPVNGLGLDLAMPKDTIIETLNGERTMTPTRPAVEPLTPPTAVAAPVFTKDHVASGGGNKRGRSPSAGAVEGEGSKKSRIDG